MVIKIILLDDKKNLKDREICKVNLNEKNMKLTKKETIVSVKILQGKSNAEIADELFISINTVKTHVANVLKKKNVKNRIQLISNQIKN
jgi:DNA-binding NarL/FixJ family response regulator